MRPYPAGSEVADPPTRLSTAKTRPFAAASTVTDTFADATPTPFANVGPTHVQYRIPTSSSLSLSRLPPALTTAHRKIFKPLHPPDALEVLSPEQHIGPVDPTTLPAPTESEKTPDEKRAEENRKKLPPVDAMLLVSDFEEWGEKVLSGTAWCYYRSAGESSGV